MTYFDEFKNRTFKDDRGNIYLLNDDGNWEVSSYDEELNFLNIVIIPQEIIHAAMMSGYIKEVSEES